MRDLATSVSSFSKRNQTRKKSDLYLIWPQEKQKPTWYLWIQRSVFARLLLCPGCQYQNIKQPARAMNPHQVQLKMHVVYIHCIYNNYFFSLVLKHRIILSIYLSIYVYIYETQNYIRLMRSQRRQNSTVGRGSNLLLTLLQGCYFSHV